MRPFLERLTEKPLLADGAMGTLLHARGVPVNACFEQLNMTRPALVTEIHRAYLNAGAEMIETNTFGANRYRLAEYGLETRVAQFIRA
ncbi:MAG: bifunctional homocysteine S-methyltransferase/methylenetetrahydrofolate reductase, partial [Blastochloris sp.]|nr:bifunctional homocysteine S-methyltransferase/methylenetetrahydrofolate reductase [Blastochloris sp.]